MTLDKVRPSSTRPCQGEMDKQCLPLSGMAQVALPLPSYLGKDLHVPDAVFSARLDWGAAGSCVRGETSLHGHILMDQGRSHINSGLYMLS